MVHPLSVQVLMCYLIKYSQPWRNVILNSLGQKVELKKLRGFPKVLVVSSVEKKGLRARMIRSLWKESMGSLLEGVPWKQKIIVHTLILSNNKQNLLNIFHVC